eukprot:734297-Pleurochrysis_carterae.AAC.21
MSYVEKIYIPGKTHVKEVCATLNQAHKLQDWHAAAQGRQWVDDYCYISDGAESLQTINLVQLLSRRDTDSSIFQLLSRRDADSNPQITTLHIKKLNSKTATAQAEAFKESLRSTAELLRKVGITKSTEPRILNFRPNSTMYDRAAAMRTAARLVRGD